MLSMFRENMKDRGVRRFFIFSIIALISLGYFLTKEFQDTRRAWVSERIFLETPKVVAENYQFVCYHQTIYGQYRESPRNEIYFLHDKKRKEYIVALMDAWKNNQ